ncbi:hypothetical protein LJC67_07985 [Bacteroidales bacterium OttesenSCG-928-A14]|nr:hypothetical protein [Bacteroidales bacterium OttesenSCG-928-A14]
MWFGLLAGVTGSGTQAGGIIKATNATFRNNQTAAKMSPFTNKTASVGCPKNEKSYPYLHLILQQNNLGSEKNQRV